MWVKGVESWGKYQNRLYEILKILLKHYEFKNTHLKRDPGKSDKTVLFGTCYEIMAFPLLSPEIAAQCNYIMADKCIPLKHCGHVKD